MNQVIKLLLENDTDPYITSIVSKNEEQSNLEAACRWNYPEIIMFYLQKVNWNIATLKKALSYCKNENAKMKIEEKIQDHKNKYFCGCWCFSWLKKYNSIEVNNTSV